MERFASSGHARVQRSSLGLFSGLDDARCCDSREESAPVGSAVETACSAFGHAAGAGKAPGASVVVSMYGRLEWVRCDGGGGACEAGREGGRERRGVGVGCVSMGGVCVERERREEEGGRGR